MPGLASAWVRLRRMARQERKLALILSTYPGRPDQIAHAVGLDGPASALKLAQHLQGEGYSINGLPSSGGELVEPFVSSLSALPLTPALSHRERGQAVPVEKASPLPWGEGQGEGVLRHEIKWGLSEYEVAFVPTAGSVARGRHIRMGRANRRPRLRQRRDCAAGIRLGNLLICLQPERGPRHRPQSRVSRSEPAAAPRLHRLLSLAPRAGGHRRADPSRRAWHARMAAGQGHGAFRSLRSPRAARPNARNLSLHRQRSGRSGAGEAAHLRRHHRAQHAAADRDRVVARAARDRAAAGRVFGRGGPRQEAPRAAGARRARRGREGRP